MPYRVDARLSGRHPFEIYMLFFAFVVSLPILLGIDPAPGSLRETFPLWGSYLWGVTLAAGSGIALAGIYWRERATGLILEQLGLIFTGIGCVLYGAAIIAALVSSGVVAAAIILGFGVSCLKRAYDIQKTLNDVHAQQRSNEEGRK